MTLSLRSMRYVQAALRTGSFRAAAEEMNVAASAIATALDQAEASFGMALVTRARAKGIFPTAAGRDVQRRIEDLLERYDAMISDVSALSTSLSGTVSIGYNAPIAPGFLPIVARNLRDQYPEVTLNFVEGDNDTIRSGLLDGQFDVILFVEETPNPQITTRPLIFAPTYCVCAEDHPLAQNQCVTLKELARAPLVILDRPAAHRFYIELLEQSGEDFQIVATANSTEMVRSLVSQGLGISLLNMRPGDIPSYTGAGVRCLPIAESRNGVTLSLGTAPGPSRMLVQIFIEACIAYFETTGGRQFVVAPAGTPGAPPG